MTPLEDCDITCSCGRVVCTDNDPAAADTRTCDDCRALLEVCS